MGYLVEFEQLVVFLLVFTRIAGFVAACPVFSMRQIPATVRAGLVFVISLALLPLAGPVAVPLDSFIGFGLALTREAAVGLGLGIFTSMVFNGVRLAGQFIGFQMGLAISEMLDPAHSQQSGVISQFMWLFGLVFFVGINGHHLLILGLAKSFDLVPLGAAVAQMKTALLVAKAFGGMFTIALTLAAPLMALLLVVDVTLGLMVQMVPQINVFMLGFPMKIIAGIFTMMVTIPVMSWVLARVFGQMTEDLLVLMRLFGGA